MPNKTTLTLLACTALLAAACICLPGYWLSDIEPEPAVATPAPEDPYSEVTGISPENTQAGPETYAACSLQLEDVLRTAEEEDYEAEGDFELDEEQPLVTYQVSGDEIHSPEYEDVDNDLAEYQEDRQGQAAVWEFFTDIIPAGQRSMLVEFVIFTDGYAGTTGAVEQAGDPHDWILGMDIADAEDFPSVSSTLVHEFGHLLTLNDTQVVIDMALFENPDDLEIYTESEAACGTYFLYEGCSQSDSYINLFYQRFWPDLYAEWQGIDSIEDEHEYEDAIWDFYAAHADQFVNDYAATNPEEDIAESWTYFIFTPRPAGDSLADQKILFFYEFPELVELRAQILDSLCGYVEE